MKKYFLPLVLLFLIGACTKDREANIKYFKEHTNTIDTTGGPDGTVLINEFVATGSAVTNEYGDAVDWIELYNTGDSTINFAANSYYITDDSTQKDKFKIDNLSIPGKGHLLVYCDDSAKITNTQIHVNFGLKAGGEFVGIYKKNGSGDFIPLTEHPFAAQSQGPSEGRYPDGGTNWVNHVPTPGGPNQ